MSPSLVNWSSYIGGRVSRTSVEPNQENARAVDLLTRFPLNLGTALSSDQPRPPRLRAHERDQMQRFRQEVRLK